MAKYFFGKIHGNMNNEVFYFETSPIPPMFEYMGFGIGDNPAEAYKAKQRQKNILLNRDYGVFVTYDSVRQQIVHVSETERLCADILKANWARDNIWDIEETDGYEKFYWEFKDFRKMMEEKWSEEESKRQIEKNKAITSMSRLDCSFQIAWYLDNLEERIHKLEAKLC